MTEYERLVCQFAWKVVRKCPSMDFEDVKQDLLLALTEARQQYKESELPFIAFAYKRLGWRSNELVRNHLRRLKAENIWSRRTDEMVDAAERGYGTLCSEVLELLDNQDEKQLFCLMAIPDTGERDRRRSELMSATEAAAYIGMSRMGQYRSLREVRKAVEQVVNG